ncbi:glycoside hydrolase family 88 protein [Rufibacter sp. XAAS-G3-1]|uniref:glycoside hydrolase family 88 protein n=1 Tax=Rufibacter sp. XAAS-G3-1 TaxID=2729134 RepID=UPI0015E70BB8|nr:glycoside hydrolase family 88 protein [Rufibacter sp. XAAS-G3-1]
MKIAILTFILFFYTAFLSKDKGKLEKATGHVFDSAQQHYQNMLRVSKDLTKYPRTSAPNGSLKYTDIHDWTGGFWPGSLWYLYEYTKDPQWLEAAKRWTESLEKNQFNNTHHDIGFMMYCSYGNGYRLTGDPKYRDVLLQSAKTLITRFNPTVGCIKSWDQKLSWDGKTMFKYPVIIDNMINLELLFFASKETGDPVYRNIALQHADNTLKNHFRPDYSSYHVVNYDAATGKVLHQETNQGFADNSTWARGQGWAIYGFTVMYRETKDNKYLQAARKMADYYLDNKNLPDDKVPYWDFNVNQPGFTPKWKYDAAKLSYIPRDASAAAVVSSALVELSQHLGSKGGKYRRAAQHILTSLSSEAYLAKPGTNNNFLLKHSVGSMPHGVEIDVPLVYADYYFLEALLRNKKS